MASSHFTTDNRTYQELVFSNSEFQIPAFQRDYCWSKEEWDELWQDICEIIESEDDDEHFMGFVVLGNQNNNVYDIVDGQQRLTTLSLVFLAMVDHISKLEEKGNERNGSITQAETLLNKYLRSNKNGDSVPKLRLNRSNHDFYSDYLLTGKNYSEKSVPESAKNLDKAFKYFKSHISKMHQPLTQFQELLGKIGRKLLFAVITVNDELNAYKIFETLNARGVKLTASDLLKNHILNTTYNNTKSYEQVKDIETQWNAIVERIPEDDFTKFLRIHWMSRTGLVRAKELFKVIKEKTIHQEAVTNLLKNMQIDSLWYRKIMAPQADDWGSDTSKNLKTISLFKVRQHLPLLLAAKNMIPRDYDKLIQFIMIFSFRYNIVCGMNPNEMERCYTSLSADISRQNSLGLWSYITNNLLEKFPSDNKFRLELKEKEFKETSSSNEIAKYILQEINFAIFGERYFPTTKSEDLYVDFIHAKPSSNEWGSRNVDQIPYYHSIGNITLLESKYKKRLEKSSFNDKRKIYAESKFRLTKYIGENYLEWGSESILTHQNFLIEQALNCWNVQSLVEDELKMSA